MLPTLSSAARDRVALTLVMFSILPILSLLVGEWEFMLIYTGFGVAAVGIALRGPRHLLVVLFAIAMAMVLVGGLVGYSPLKTKLPVSGTLDTWFR